MKKWREAGTVLFGGAVGNGLSAKVAVEQRPVGSEGRSLWRGFASRESESAGVY